MIQVSDTGVATPDPRQALNAVRMLRGPSRGSGCRTTSPPPQLGSGKHWESDLLSRASETPDELPGPSISSGRQGFDLPPPDVGPRRIQLSVCQRPWPTVRERGRTDLTAPTEGSLGWWPDHEGEREWPFERSGDERFRPWVPLGHRIPLLGVPGSRSRSAGGAGPHGGRRVRGADVRIDPAGRSLPITSTCYFAIYEHDGVVNIRPDAG